MKASASAGVAAFEGAEGVAGGVDVAVASVAIPVAMSSLLVPNWRVQRRLPSLS
jgi:hypothetical protein